MVLDYYKLQEQPFGVTPDARFLYLSATHREALASLLYGVSAGRGFVALIAKPGMGKTTLLFQSLEQLQQTTRTVFLFQTISTPLDFLRALLTDLGLDAVGGDLIELQSKLNQVLLEQSRSGKPLILFIDEAQNLDGSIFELVRMLSNFETSRDKLMQIVLCGQPQLAEKLASSSLEQLRQRVSMIAQLKPFSAEETKLYVEHRLRVAGYRSETPLFTDPALVLVATRSEGIPRNINNLCFNALSLGCALKQKTIDTGIVLEVLRDLDLSSLRETSAAPALSTAKATPAAPCLALSSVETRVETRSRASRILKFAVAAIVLVALGWTFPRVDRGERESTEVQASVAAPPSELVEKSPSTPIAEPPQAPVAFIRVTQGERLYQICREQFGSCSPGDIQQIRRLNPWLNDPDHIEPGQTIRVPLQAKVAGTGRSAVKQPNRAFPTEAGKP